MGASVGGTRQLTPEEEHQIIDCLLRKAIDYPKKVGDVYYVLSNRWYEEWLSYVGHGAKNFMFGSKPGSIDNSDLVKPGSIDNSDLVRERCNNCDTGPELHSGLKGGTDFVLFPKDAWTQLYKWYGGGPILPRKMAFSANCEDKVAVDVYPVCLLLVVAPEEKEVPLRMSKTGTLGELYRRACELLKLRSEQIFIWNYKGRTRRNLLVYREDQTLEEAKIEMGQEVSRGSTCLYSYMQTF